MSLPLLLGSCFGREGDIWGPDTPQGSRCLLNARLFPVLHACEPLRAWDVLWFLGFQTRGQLQRWRASWRMSWEELLTCLDQAAELESRRALFFLQAKYKLRSVLLEHQDCSLLPLIRSAVHEGYQEAMLSTLDQGESQLGQLPLCPAAELAPLVSCFPHMCFSMASYHDARPWLCEALL